MGGTRIVPTVLCVLLALPSYASPDETTAMRQWVNAKFGEAAQVEPAGSLTVVANYFEIWKNGRVDRPLTLGASEYRRGLYVHGPSDILVKLPAPGKAFTATVGVDSNAQTRGGQGSIVFTVAVDGREAFTSPVMREGMPGVPVSVDLAGATELNLRVGNTEDGIACDQGAWVDAKVVLNDGRELWVGDLPVEGASAEPADGTAPPFSFKYGDKTSADLLPGFTKEATISQLDNARRRHETRYRDPATGLEIRCVADEYIDFPTVEWTLYFKNTGDKDTPILSDIMALDARFNRRPDDVYAAFARPGEFTLHHHTGSICAPNDYEPHATVLRPSEEKQLASAGGRGSNGEFPYFNVEWPGEGVVAAVGWPGQWRATFMRDESTGLRIAAGQELTHFTLHPGEEVRTPLVALQFWKGDPVDAQNTWRRWMIAHNVPRPGGQPHPTHLSGCSSHFFGEMVTADEASQIQFIDRYLEERIPIDYWWMDAGWYINETGWPNTGTWEVDTKRFPRGLRAITDHAHAKGLQTIVWFEPERVTPGTWLYTTHPEWLLGKDGEQKLLDLGNPEARQWLTDHVDRLLTEQGIDLYRQDFNMDPLAYWRANDAPDRQGITEIRHVTGYLAYWDELIRRRPGLLIDTCASGGRRNDLETLRRAVPLWRTDYILEPIGTQGCTYGISSWVPFHGTGVKEPDAYRFRSMMTPYPNCLWDARRADLDYDEFRRLVSQWEQVAPNYTGDYYPLTPYSLDNAAWIGWQFDRPEAGEGMVQVLRRDGSIYRAADLRLRGVDRYARYTVTDLDAPDSPREFSGADLLDNGLPIEIAPRPGSALYTYKRVNDMVLSAPATHSDWMLRDGLEWGPAGVHHMLDACKASGWTRVYWRALDGGRSLYKSALMDPQGKWDADNFWNPATEEDRKLLESYTTGMSPEARAALLQRLERYDYGTFDTLAEAVRYGHEIGLEVHAWISINEDDHGWGLVSRFARAHPETVWKKRDGTPYRSQLSFAYPEVMQYKLAVVKEILDGYDVDGLFIDWLRTGDVRDNPQTDADGVADHGYEDPLVATFKEKHGKDPLQIPNGDDDWVRFRAEPHTEFMRGVRKLADAKRPGLPVTVLVANPWCYRGAGDKIDGNLRGLLIDVATWAREGLIDAAVPAGYYRDGGTPEKAYAALKDETGGQADVWFYAWVPETVDAFNATLATAQALGARQILFWEADYIDARPDKEDLQKAMRAAVNK